MIVLTPAERLEQHLAALLALLEPPYTAGWREYAWDKAKTLAEEDKELADLPRRLKEAMATRLQVEA